MELRQIFASSYPPGPPAPIPLHRMDILMAYCPLDFIWVFEGTISADALAESLSRILSSYWWFSSRYGKQGDEYVLLPRNQGVPFVLVRGDPSTPFLQREHFSPDKYCLFPDVSKIFSGSEAVLHVKLTQLANGGSVLGVSLSHGVADGWSFSIFMQDWSRAHRGEAISAVCLLPRELTSPQTPTELEASARLLGHVTAMSGWSLRCMTFGLKFMLRRIQKWRHAVKRSVVHFPSSELRALKAQAEKEAGTWVSTNEALIAHLYPLLLETFGPPHLSSAQSEALGVLMAVNLRDKMAGITSRMIGNASVGATIHLPGCDRVYRPVAEGDQKNRRGEHVTRERQEADEEDEGKQKTTWQSLALQTHLCTRQSLQPSWLAAAHALTYRSTDVLFQHPLVHDRPLVVLWQNQAMNGIMQVDWGAGEPLHGVPWNYLEGVKVMDCPPSKNGAVDIYISHSDYFLTSWNPPGWINWPGRVAALGITSSVLLCVVDILAGKKLINRGKALFACGTMTVLWKIGSAIAQRHCKKLLDDRFEQFLSHPRLHFYAKR
eukprot:gb/GEZN01002801.1/.p1 GENE.gb/GEZN01002801.1/~~gb/GEZN01002801.1/.p1  ORF type:complete len:548 (-),score=43.10 gb/GEZN01002801.1/:677-2320(-)